MIHNRVDITGEKFGNLTAVSFKAGTRTTPSAWLCECKCGNKTYATAGALRSGQRTSCGCSRSTATKEHLATDAVNGTRKSALNAKLHKGNTSGVKGVTWLKSRNKWRAYIGFRGRQINLGYYTNKDDAIAARKKAEQELHEPYKNM